MKNKISKALIDALFPPRCILCDEIIAPNRYLCNYCHTKILKVGDKRCAGCGRSINRCNCNRFVYHFDGVISPFYNEGPAKQAFYQYKFFRYRRTAEFYAINMAESVKEYYQDIKFDFLTYVCSSDRKPLFDHCKILADELSNQLELELVELLKPSSKKRSVQHTLGFENRFENVHNAYEVKSLCKNKVILLVDDIKTSGATIDECARIMKIAGAKAVYCVTALVGNTRNKH